VDPAPADVTTLLQAWSRGEVAALDRLLPAVYGDLRRLAGAQLRREGRAHTLQPTALVHELFLRLAGQERARWHNRAQFLALCAGLMRRVLIDHARRRRRLKRGGTLCRVDLADQPAAAAQDVDVITLDRALDELKQLDAGQARMVELRFFGGLSVEEVAEVTGVSSRTVKRDWRSARAFLLTRLTEPDP
jgi:RNA polymerase sigma factor (TIGR02999 family)